MDYLTLAQRVRSKYPGEYDDLDDKTLAQKVVAKYPEYSDTTFEEPQKETPKTESAGEKPLIPKTVVEKAAKVTEFMPPLPGIKTAATAVTQGLKTNMPVRSDIPAIAASAATAGISNIPFAARPALRLMQAAKIKEPASKLLAAGKVAAATVGGTAGKVAEDAIEGKKASVGSLWEGAKQGAYEFAGKALETVGKAAPGLAASALGFTKRFLSTKSTQKAAIKTGEMALEKGVMGVFSSPEGMRDAVEQIKQESGKKIGEFLDRANGGFYVKKAINALEDLRPAERGGIWDTIHSQIDNAVATLKGVGEDKIISYKKANEIKGLFQEVANYKRNPKATILDQKIAGIVKDNIDESLSYSYSGAGKTEAEQKAAKEAYKEFLKNKKVYGLMSRAEDALTNRIGSEMGKEKFGLHDVVALAAGGLPADLMYRTVKKVGTQNAALLAKKAGWTGTILPGLLRGGESSAKTIKE